MTTKKEELLLESIPQASDIDFIELVKSFAVIDGAMDINASQRDGATAIIDLAVEFQEFGRCADREKVARVLGRLSDIQVRDFALGSHNAQSFNTYWQMWHFLLQVAPEGFIAPVACLFATLAYEHGDTTLAYRALERASLDQPTYSLMVLLRRTFNSGWPASAFTAMRNELHPKVTAGIFE